MQFNISDDRSGMPFERESILAISLLSRNEEVAALTPGACPRSAFTAGLASRSGDTESI